MKKGEPSANSITFLGTAGARFMVSKQLAASGGLWLSLSGTEILLDPGPGSIVQSTKRKLNPENLSAVIVSHRHLDHAADVNIMVEAMTNAGTQRRGWLFAPSDALDEEPVILSYLRDYLSGIEVLEEGGSYSVGNVSFTTPLRHDHRVETYGMVFRAGGYTFSYIADGRYSDNLCASYEGELLIINVVLLEQRPEVDHLSIPEAGRIISELKPRVAILTHFGTTIWRAKPWQVAEELSRQTGVRVLAARDGMKFDLDGLDA